MELGNVIELALSNVGVTKQRVKEWIGKECYCEERRDKLNSLSLWAKRVVKGNVDRAVEYLDRIMNDD